MLDTCRRLGLLEHFKKSLQWLWGNPSDSISAHLLFFFLPSFPGQYLC